MSATDPRPLPIPLVRVDPGGPLDPTTWPVGVLLPPTCGAVHPRADVTCLREQDHRGSHQNGDRVWRTMTMDPYRWPDARVAGNCPACGRESLFIGAGGHVTCSRLGCPRPTAVDELLADRMTDHVVVLGATDFTVRHPLRERLDDALLTCDLHARISRLDGPPRQPGTYGVVVLPDGSWVWTELR